jgi:hypothetical protein
MRSAGSTKCERPADSLGLTGVVDKSGLMCRQKRSSSSTCQLDLSDGSQCGNQRTRASPPACSALGAAGSVAQRVRRRLWSQRAIKNAAGVGR